MRRKLLTFIYVGTGVAASLNVWRLYRILFSHWLYDRDYSQIYLMGLALRSGVYLYEPIPSLASRFNPSFGHFLQHPSAYPPIVALLGVPLSLLPYFWSVVVWSLWEIGCLVVVTHLVFRHFGGRKAPTPLLVTLVASLAWQPVFVDLYRGQVMLTILLLLTLTWLAFRSNHDVKAGVFLGLSLSLKFYGWPILLLFILTRRWKAALTSATLFAFSNALMALWLGFDLLRDYYLKVAPGIAQIWRTDVYNFSVMGLGYRLFGQTGSILFLIVALCICMFAALKARDQDHSFMVVLAASSVLAPISWIHYFATLLPALCLVASRKEWGTREAMIALAVGTVLFLGYLPFQWSATWGTLPLFGLAGLVWLLQSPQVRSRVARLDGGIQEVA